MRFHKDLGFPAKFTIPTHVATLVHSNHSRDQSARRGIAISNAIDFSRGTVIEVGYSKGKLNHMLVRMPYDNRNDISFALIPLKGKWLVKTMWLNEKDDTHSTLDLSQYATV